ncbi:endoplasmic reticulum-Golgi intermediate compartment protein 2-like protein [Dinothrombium tinctorium]|uniref:Endoplasmic reticulum-Golgi intermediate compartment protein 2-like protein n=1 Tax=Dinothrombium tinctorium TaxID=1965070 RepID=A0A443RL24_9ACAR|nr:endoplasmic reticulum-Golgi intermediate compartment protein 2-like protein [Dinothrombium tinctorium]
MTLVRRIVGKRNLADFDAFPKVPETYTETTAAGGTDITVAMPCDMVGADIIDVTNQNNAYTYGRLNEEPTYFELTDSQQVQWDAVRDINNYLRDEHHSLRDFLWRKDTRNQFVYGRPIPPRNILPDKEPDACRIHGTLIVNKVAGNFHITVGKHIPLPIGHAHISLTAGMTRYNFSHRIERFSFGEHIPSIINPLEGEEKITTAETHLFQYYVKVISTDIQTTDIKMHTYQYSTTEKDRIINHEKDSHGSPGIYFKYDIDAIGVRVVEEYMPFWKFLVRLCGIVGGIYATSGLINTIVTGITDLVTCK